MRTRGEGDKHSEIFVDITNGSTQRRTNDGVTPLSESTLSRSRTPLNLRIKFRMTQPDATCEQKSIEK